jgi:hypothetical protein
MGWLRSSISSIRMFRWSLSQLPTFPKVAPVADPSYPSQIARGRTLLAICNRGYSSFELFFVAYTRSCIAHICGIHSAISFPFNLPKIKGPAKGPNR